MKINKNLFFTNLFVGTILCVCVVYSKVWFFTFVSLSVLVFYCLYVFKNRPEYFIKYMMCFYSMVASVIGCIICEFTTLYLNEIDTYAHFAGSAPLLILVHWLIMSLILSFDNYTPTNELQIKSKGTNKSYIYIKYFTWVYFGFSLILFLKVMFHPSFILGVDRVGYASMGYVTGIWEKISNFMQYLVVIPIMYIFYVDKKKGLLFILPYILYLFWTGNKFGTFFNIFYIFLFVIYGIMKDLGYKKIRSILLMVFFAVFLLVGISLVAISFSGDYKIDEYFFNRVAQQGQMWWKSYDLFYGNPKPDGFINEIKGAFFGNQLITENVGANYGIYNLMYLLAPKQKVDYKIMAGSRYTEATFGSILYYFGISGLLITCLIIAFITTKLTNAAIKAIRSEQIIKAMLLLRLYLAFRVAVTIFVFYDFLDLISIITYIYLIFIGNKKITFRKMRGVKSYELLLSNKDKEIC